MKTGDADGLDVVYDDEAQLILSERERLYGRRGLTVDAYELGFLNRKALFDTGLWMIYYTNQRVVGLRDMTNREEEVYLGTLRAIDRSRFIGPQGEAHHVLRYFEFPLKDIVKVDKAGNRYLKLVIQSEDRRYEFRFRPWGAACRFFSVLLRKQEAG
ncbi:MAG: hypothetical protein ACE5HJ_06320 [Thermoplasmata archaeon]